jgi:antagonist of KipI
VSEIIEVMDGGLHTTVQDLGRYGYQRYGVPVSGAMDVFSLRAANLLLGNSEDAAGLEITLVGPKLKFLSDTAIALCGADLRPRVDGQLVQTWKVLKIKAGSLLSFDGPMAGMRCYMAVPGGIDVPEVMGSRSTYTRSSIGGFKGRTLRPGDRLANIDGANPPSRSSKLPQALIPAFGHQHLLRVVMGPQDEAFTPQGVASFLGSTYAISQQSDRVGIRLDGPAIQHVKGGDIISDGAPFGAVQVPGSGRPVVLMADRGTTGGYTKIATVIAVDIGKLAQALPGDKVTFKPVTVDEAQALLAEREDLIKQFREQTQADNRSEGSKVRIAVDGTVLLIADDSGLPLTETAENANGASGSRRTVTVKDGEQAYTFEVETQRQI